MTAAILDPETEAKQATLPSLRPDIARIALTGFMGAGKSTVGRLLADRLGWRFFDIDKEVEQRSNRTVADIFAMDGERAFRSLESHALARALGQTGAVLALGGGAPEILSNRLLLEQTPRTAVIFLDAGLGTLLRRCHAHPDSLRPLLLDEADITRRFHHRTPFYRRIAHLRIDTETAAPEQTALQILHALSMQTA